MNSLLPDYIRAIMQLLELYYSTNDPIHFEKSMAMLKTLLKEVER